MVEESSSVDDDDESPGVVTPRWVTPALFALGGVTAIALMLTGRVLFGLVLAAVIAVVLVLGVIFRTQLRAFNRRAGGANKATYGWFATIGVGWVILGAWRLTTPGSDLILGAVCVVFGLLMVLAYAPKFFQSRSFARSR
jgi:hypothetical protein